MASTKELIERWEQRSTHKDVHCSVVYNQKKVRRALTLTRNQQPILSLATLRALC